MLLLARRQERPAVAQLLVLVRQRGPREGVARVEGGRRRWGRELLPLRARRQLAAAAGAGPRCSVRQRAQLVFAVVVVDQGARGVAVVVVVALVGRGLG